MNDLIETLYLEQQTKVVERSSVLKNTLEDNKSASKRKLEPVSVKQMYPKLKEIDQLQNLKHLRVKGRSIEEVKEYRKIIQNCREMEGFSAKQKETITSEKKPEKRMNRKRSTEKEKNSKQTLVEDKKTNLKLDTILMNLMKKVVY